MDSAENTQRNQQKAINHNFSRLTRVFEHLTTAENQGNVVLGRVNQLEKDMNQAKERMENFQVQMNAQQQQLNNLSQKWFNISLDEELLQI